MPNPYDVALRERAVMAYEAGGGSYAELSAGLQLGQRTLERWVAQHRATGDVTPKPKAGGWRSPIAVDVLHGVIAERPDATIEEMRRRYNASVSKTARVSWSAMGRALARLGYVLKKTAATVRSGSPGRPRATRGVPEMDVADRSTAARVSR